MTPDKLTLQLMGYIRALEQQRADLWRQAAHDLRGNLGVVAFATAGLAHAHPDTGREKFADILERNMTSLHHLLDDVTSLARLQAGTEQPRVGPIDVTPMIQELCEGIRPLAQQRRLFLRSDGPLHFAVEGDAVKIRRITQNLLLNAVKFTRDGGITVRWGDCGRNDSGRWALSIKDTGPGLRQGSDSLLAEALSSAPQALSSSELVDSTDERAGTDAQAPPAPADDETSAPLHDGGEGIGLSIVKRLCELLDATIEMESVPDVGTIFRVIFPRKYSP
jgi:signal transduction histidine kinase